VSSLLDVLFRFFRLNTLKRRIRFWVSAIILTLGLLILVTSYLTEAHSRTAETNRQLKNTIVLQRLYIERWLSDHSAQIDFLAANFKESVLDEGKVRDTFTSFMSAQDEFTAVVYVNSLGRVIVDTAGPALSGNDLSGREYFREAQQGRSFITDIMVARNTSTSVVIVSAPVRDREGNFNGLVFGALKTAAFEKLMSQFSFGNEGETYLLDRNGKFITPPGSSGASREEVYNKSDIYTKAIAGIESKSSYVNYGEEKVIGQYGWTKGGQWLIVAEMKYRGVFDSLYQNMVLMSGIVLVVYTLSYFLLAFLLTAGVQRPLHLLMIGTKIMREGNYDYRIRKEEIASAPVEVKELCDAFNITSQRLKSTIQMLEQTAVVDQLTELYNRRFILTEGPKLLETCIRAEQPCSVLMIDIDFFKKVNDTYGHMVGDRVIIYAASNLMACIRSCDMVSRYGGEEFLILAPNTEEDPGALIIGERIRSYFADNPYREEGLELGLTVSIGVSDYRLWSSYGRTALEDMISRADQALYKAKHNGRNRVEALTDSEAGGDYNSKMESGEEKND
jgi:diguanylate cyclase (GGDEF)-like protein